ncbi:MAG: alpha/beta hydrolase [Deltaproteobacteria bacterium]|nr:alpha/beta hydrolase [Deltaproteobacteria bacterium]
MRTRHGSVRSRDGTRIAFHTIGNGSPIFCCNGLGVSTYFWQSLAAAFSARHRVVCWDYRGHGRSAAPPRPTTATLHHLVEDGLAVIEHLDLREVTGVGHSIGFQILLHLYGTAPARFSHLVSFLGVAAHPLTTFYDSAWSRAGFDLLYLVATYYPRAVAYGFSLLHNSAFFYALAGQLGIIDPTKACKREIARYLSHVADRDPQLFVALLQGAEAAPADHVCAEVAVPTLLIAAEADRFIPLHVIEAMHRQIGTSRLVVIPQGSHAALMETPAFFNDRLAAFLRDHAVVSGRTERVPADRSATIRSPA